ncbi:MAG: hypothetical protein IJY42_04385, partial [Clostridia bacterium]|nr:hypothetical protein [Clostridia bacterium]
EDGATHTLIPGRSTLRSGSRSYTEENRKRIEASGVTWLEDAYAVTDGIAFGGLSSGLMDRNEVPKTPWLTEFASLEHPRVLLCHHPEYYEPYLKPLSLDLIVSGHAHGGQWRFFGRGVYAPGQGLFPRYTRGLYDRSFVISTGLKRGFPIPRFFNPPELCVIDVT